MPHTGLVISVRAVESIRLFEVAVSRNELTERSRQGAPAGKRLEAKHSDLSNEQIHCCLGQRTAQRSIHLLVAALTHQNPIYEM